MYSLILLGVVSFVLALLVTPAVRSVARRWGLVDVPNEERRIHAEPVPRVGGVAIVVAYAGAFGVLFLAGLAASGMVRGAMPVVERLLPAALVVFVTGLADDVWGLRPWQKFAGQLAAAGLAIWAGVTVNGVAGFQLAPWLAIPVTVLWLVGCANAFNLIDGVDGLAAGVGLFATVTMLVTALIYGNVPLALAVAPLAGALLGFLRFNFNPATIFLGDSGSLTVGFLLGCFGVLWGHKAATVLGLTAPLMALAVPLLDTGLSIARRFLRGKPVWDADRGHIHHRLLDRGLTPRRVALLLYGVAALGAVFSVAQSFLENNFGGVVVLLFAGVAWMGVQHLGYVEFGVAGRMFLDGAFRRHLSSQLALRGFEEAMRRAETPEKCWEALAETAREYGYGTVLARIAGRDFYVSREWGEDDVGRPVRGWNVQIPLSETDFVSLEGLSNGGAYLARVGPFADAIQRTLREKEFAAEPLPVVAEREAGRVRARGAAV